MSINLILGTTGTCLDHYHLAVSEEFSLSSVTGKKFAHYVPHCTGIARWHVVYHEINAYLT